MEGKPSTKHIKALVMIMKKRREGLAPKLLIRTEIIVSIYVIIFGTKNWSLKSYADGGLWLVAIERCVIVQYLILAGLFAY